jgi:ribosome-binding factor A
MKSRRTAKVAQAILQSVSSTILFGLKDPRVHNVTVVHVDVSPDIRTAKVYVSILGDEKVQSLCMHGLNSARGFLQAKLAERLKTRHTPVLKFVLDDSVKKSALAARILSEILPDSANRGVIPEGHVDNCKSIDDWKSGGAESALDGGSWIGERSAADDADRGL